MELKNDLFDGLIDLADRFCCAIEMATYLAMMLLGGPKRCFLWYYDSPSLLTNGGIPEKEPWKLLTSCQDDLVLALLLMRMFQSCSTNTEREQWCKAWQINYAAMLSVDLIMDRLLGDRFCHEDHHETMRPIDLRLIDKVRLLIAHHLATLEYARSTLKEEKIGLVKGGIYHTASSQQKLRVHQASIFYKRDEELKSYLYFFSQQERDRKEIEPEQVVLLPDWCSDIVLGEKLDDYDIADLIVKHTRMENRIEVRSHWMESSSQQNSVFLKTPLSELIKPLVSTKRDVLTTEVIEVKNHYVYQNTPGITVPLEDDVIKTLQIGMIYEGTVERVFPHPYHYALIKLQSRQYGFLYSSHVGGVFNDILADERINVGNKITVRLMHMNIGRKRIFFSLAAGEPQVGLKEKAIIREIRQSMAIVMLGSGEYAILHKSKIRGRHVTDMREVFFMNEEILVEIVELEPRKRYDQGRTTIYVSTTI